MLRVELKALFEEVRRCLQVLLLEIDASNLAKCLEMCWVVVDDKSVVLDGVLDMLELMEDLSKAKVSWYTHRIKLDAVSKVFLRLKEVTRVSKLCGQMNACSKVTLIMEQALLEMVDGLFELLELFKLASDMEVSLKVALLLHGVWVGSENLQTFLEGLKSILILVLLLKNTTKLDIGFSKLRVDFDDLENNLVSLVELFIITLVDLCKLDHAVDVLRIDRKASQQRLNSLNSLVVSDLAKSLTIEGGEVLLITSGCLHVVGDGFVILTHLLVSSALLDIDLYIIGLAVD